MKDYAAIILAAGKGTRMKSELPKVAHNISGTPLVVHVIRAVRKTGIKKIVVVVGYEKEIVIDLLRDENVEIVEQKQQLGTGHALAACSKVLSNFKGSVLVLAGDVYCEHVSTLKTLCSYHKKSRNDMSILSVDLEQPKGYGRIIRGTQNDVIAIREELDASGEEKNITEINSGIYVFKAADVFAYLKKIKKNTKKKEYYLTDVVDVYGAHKKKVGAKSVTNAGAILGVNDRVQLADIQVLHTQRILQMHQRAGVTIIDPSSTYIEDNVCIGKDTVIYPFSYIESNVKIGSKCAIGPFCKIRSCSSISSRAAIGSFVEVVRSKVGEKTNIKHLSYIGDAVVGSHVNIGAGTITANYDGKYKHTTRINDNAFIGSNTVLVAPISVGRGAKTGAGSVVLKNKNIGAGQIVCGVPARAITKKKTKSVHRK